jgi:apolipoprotein D and lipocalin family protein
MVSRPFARPRPRPTPAAALGLALWLAAVGAAAALSAPPPRKPVETDRSMGRWFEIYRTPNLAETNCYAPYQDWRDVGAGRFAIVHVCHHGSASGPEHATTAKAHILDSSADKLEISFFAGLLKRNYWVLDHADDYSWMIASTANGRYVSVLARAPGLPLRQAQALRAEVAEMGLNADKLVYVGADAG